MILLTYNYVDLLCSVALGQGRRFVCLSGIHWATHHFVSWVEVVSTIQFLIEEIESMTISFISRVKATSLMEVIDLA